MVKAVLFAATIMLFTSAYAGADEFPDDYGQSISKFSISVLNGTAMPAGDLWHNDSFYVESSGVPYNVNWGNTVSAATAVAADYEITNDIALGMQVGRDWRHGPQTAAPATGGNITISQYTPYVKLLNRMGKITMYSVFGAGYYTVKADDLVLDGESMSSLLSYGHKNGYFGFNVGAGGTYALGGGLEVGLDVTWHHICSNFSQVDLTSDAQVSQISITNVTPSLRIQYDFNL